MDERIEEIRNFIDSDWNRHISVSLLADRVCLSVSRLEHLFKQEVGMSIRSYTPVTQGCSCPQYYDCVRVETCDECLYNGLEYCVDDYWGCETYVQVTFNDAFGCCSEEGGEYI